MAFWDNWFRGNQNKRLESIHESVRVATNNDDENGMHYNPLKTISTIFGEDDLLNIGEVNQFRLLRTERSEKFNSYDLMAQDSRIASILNMYADDCTQYNQSSQVIWAEGGNPDAVEFANRIIDNLQLNKSAWAHIYSLCKYGDLYLELFYDDELGESQENNEEEKSRADVKIYEQKQGARLTEHIEAVKNPAGIFDLFFHGKTAFYVRVNKDENSTYNAMYQKSIYTYQDDEESVIMPADKYIHICINDAYTRFPCKYIVKDKETDLETLYDVREGTSVLANVFKVWSELNLLEDSVLLNRLSKSAIVRLIQIEVGNTDDTDVQEILQALRDRISRSRYLDKSTGSYKNQINPGPLENIVYHATHKGNGAITHSTMGGDVDVKALADLDYFLEKLANGISVPKAYLMQKNDDGGGLSAGTSLTKFDARYGRTLKRYQTAYISGIVDLINTFAYKRGLFEYINDFNIKMISPSAVEDNERDEKLQTHTNMIRDIMQIVENEKESYKPVVRKQILNYLIQNMLQDDGLNDILKEDYEKTHEELEKEQAMQEEEEFNGGF